jgi:hypothetical protein
LSASSSPCRNRVELQPKNTAVLSPWYPGFINRFRWFEAINRKRGSSSFRFSLKTLGLPQKIGVLGFRSSSGTVGRRWVSRNGADSISSRWWVRHLLLFLPVLFFWVEMLWFMV